MRAIVTVPGMRYVGLVFVGAKVQTRQQHSFSVTGQILVYAVVPDNVMSDPGEL